MGSHVMESCHASSRYMPRTRMGSGLRLAIEHATHNPSPNPGVVWGYIIKLGVCAKMGVSTNPNFVYPPPPFLLFFNICGLG